MVVCGEGTVAVAAGLQVTRRRGGPGLGQVGSTSWARWALWPTLPMLIGSVGSGDRSSWMVGGVGFPNAADVDWARTALT
jgi:hypothetical protein